MSASLRSASALVAALVVALLGVPATASAAPSAPPEWKASVYPTQGADDEPFEIHTSGGCPLPATNILGTVYGKGFPRTGAYVIGNTAAGVTTDAPFTAGLYTTLREFMFQQDDPVPFEGDYRLVVTCRTPEYETSHGDYVAVIRFTDPHHWKLVAPVTTEVGPRGGSTDPGAVDGEGSPAPSGEATAGASGNGSEAPSGAKTGDASGAKSGGASGEKSEAAPGQKSGGASEGKSGGASGQPSADQADASAAKARSTASRSSSRSSTC